MLVNAFIEGPVGLAYTLPGAKPCAWHDSNETLIQETVDLARSLPPGYHTFRITRDFFLQVVAADQSIRVAMKSIPHERIASVWGDVLARHHPHCSTGGGAVEFVTPSGKDIFTAVTMN
jgi:hypothetical protein